MGIDWATGSGDKSIIRSNHGAMQIVSCVLPRKYYVFGELRHFFEVLNIQIQYLYFFDIIFVFKYMNSCSKQISKK